MDRRRSGRRASSPLPARTLLAGPGGCVLLQDRGLEGAPGAEVVREELPEEPQREELETHDHEDEAQREERVAALDRPLIPEPEPRQVRGDPEAARAEEDPQGGEIAPRPALVAHEKEDDEQVEEAAEDPVAAVARLPVLPGGVRDLHLGDAEALPASE